VTPPPRPVNAVPGWGGKALLMGVPAGHPSRLRTAPTLEGVDNRKDVRQEVSEFLTTRRARVTPDQVGLPTTGSRRVPGLRRSEVASLAGLSVEYYARLERGQIAGASSGVLEALARALQLDETERAHLFDLARAADGIPTSGRPRRRTPSKAASRLSLRWALEAITEGWPSSATHTRTCWPPTPSAARSTHR
jgi:transcriptional regulator with XRE-family HTH domain